MHGERGIGLVAATGKSLERHKCALLELRVRHLYTRLGLSLHLQTQLQLMEGCIIELYVWQSPRFQASAVKTRLVRIEALADDFTALYNNRSMAIVEWGKISLLKAKGQVVLGTWRHFDFDLVWEFWGLFDLRVGGKVVL